ncbi:MAG: hypothetical protein RL110_912 [Bacteroidota bacterium]|jgi:hypothetical protein
MDYISLIANTGIQFTDFKIPLNPEKFRTLKFNYYEGLDSYTLKYWFEELVEIKNLGKFIRKSDLSQFGINQHQLNDDFTVQRIVDSSIALFYEGEDRTYSIRNVEKTLKSFEKQWIPLPYFKNNQINNNLFGPTDWVRFWYEYDAENGLLRAVLSTDTSISDDPSQNHTPLYNSNPNENKYCLCSNEDSIMSFMSEFTNCNWVASWLENILPLKEEDSQTKHLATYVHLLRILIQSEHMPTLQLLSDQSDIIDLDLSIDVGNSHTCAILFETPSEGEINFNKVKKLKIRDLSNPIKTHSDGFSTRVVFRDEAFGMKESFFPLQQKFQWPSVVRIGFEAEKLIHSFKIVKNIQQEYKTHNSSPKRYLWDDKKSRVAWKFHDDATELSKNVYRKGISEQLKSDGSFCNDDAFGALPLYSRKTLMTFLFLEIFSQAIAQFNSFEFRSTHGRPNARRRLRHVVISCPTGMVKAEQIALRQCAEEASKILVNFAKKINSNSAVVSPIISDSFEIIPRIADLKKNMDEPIEDIKDWMYDEATCSQLVFMYGLIQHKFDGNPQDLFKIFGHKNEQGNQVLTVGSLDIGGGTSDLMICEYDLKFNNSTELTPKPLFHEGFHIAGDDLMKNLVQGIIIEGQQFNDEYKGCSGVIENYGRTIIGEDIREKINGFFGRDAATMSYMTQLMRINFLNQIGIPLVLKFMDIANETEQKTYTYAEIFDNIAPSKDILDFFYQHFGFRFEELEWNLNPRKVNEIIRSTFSSLIKQVAKLMHLYRCDFIVISGRPCNFKSIEQLFLEIHPVQPNRFINLNNYWIGKWFPFSDNNGYIQDPKTIVSTGALIGLMGTRFFKLNRFKINSSGLKERLKSTANYLGPIKENQITDIFLKPQDSEANFSVYGLPFKIGMKHIASTHYPSRYIYQIQYNMSYIETMAKGQTMHNQGNLANKIQDIINQNNALLPFKFKISREFDLNKEKLTIEEVIDSSGESRNCSLFVMKLITLPSENGYWFDTAEFTLSINSRI